MDVSCKENINMEDSLENRIAQMVKGTKKETVIIMLFHCGRPDNFVTNIPYLYKKQLITF